MNYLDLDVSFELSGKIPKNWNFASAFRGIFGRSLMKLNCIQRNIDCSNCSLSSCVYYQIFEKRDDYLTYRPYIIYQKKFEENRLSILFRFFGDFVANYNQLILALIHMENYFIKIKGEKHKFKINRIHSDDSIVYDKNTGEIYQAKTAKQEMPICNEELDILLQLQTPLRIKKNNSLMRDFDFRSFYTSIYKRLNYFNEHFLNEKYELPKYDKNEPSILRAKTKWTDTNRFSQRQRQQMQFGGITGEIDINKITPSQYSVLKFGEIIHAGRQTTFGLGKYKIYKK